MNILKLRKLLEKQRLCEKEQNIDRFPRIEQFTEVYRQVFGSDDWLEQYIDKYLTQRRKQKYEKH